MKIDKRKGVSPIIAVLLMILIAIAAGIMVYAFIAGWIGGATAGTTVVQGQLTVDFATANTTNITIFVRNVGGVQVRLEAIYVTAANGSLIYTNTSLAKADLTINPGEVINFTIPFKGDDPINLEVGNVYTVRLVASDGSTLVFSVRAQEE